MITSAIAVMCAGMATTSPRYQEACNKGFEAVSIQYGAAKRVDDLAKRVENRAKRAVPEEAGLVLTAVYTVAIAREARISTGKFPGVQSTTLALKIDSATLTFSWSF